MLSYDAIRRNLQLMLLQVRKQLENMRRLLDAPESKLVQAIARADDYVDTQKSMLENECFELLSRHKVERGPEVDFVRAVATITGNLERIADFAANVALQTRFLSDPTHVHRYDYGRSIDRLLGGMDLVIAALFERDAQLAMRIGYVEDELDEIYQEQLQAIIADLRNTSDVEDRITTLFILHYLERMGDALKNIGEAILLAVLGQRLKIHQYEVLDETSAGAPNLRRPLTELELSSIWGTRSGMRIGTMQSDAHAADAHRVVYKEGDREKLQQERETLERWAQLEPGLVPSVVEFQEVDRGAAMLLQYMDGVTLQDLVLNADTVRVGGALRQLEVTLTRVWTRTRVETPCNGRYLKQLEERLGDVFRLHPRLDGKAVEIGGVAVPRLRTLLPELRPLDAELAAPFSVFIHGDFNIDNILYNAGSDRVHFIDTHRSRPMDYVQDVSVYCLSNFRLPVFAARTRQTLEAVVWRMLRFARAFARAQNDGTFEARLALGLVRSFVTSTRFELNARFARGMHQRATILLTRLRAHRGRPWEEFRMPDSVLAY